MKDVTLHKIMCNALNTDGDRKETSTHMAPDMQGNALPHAISATAVSTQKVTQGTTADIPSKLPVIKKALRMILRHGEGPSIPTGF